MTRRGLPASLFVLLAIATVGLAVFLTPAAAAAPASGDISNYVLGPDGVVYSWSPGDTTLGPLPSTLTRLGGHPVNDLSISESGERMVVLIASPPEGAARHRRHEGAALVVSLPPAPAPPRILNEIEFDGDGRRVALSGDGRLAYVLAIRAGSDPTSGPILTWVHAVDLDRGSVVSSAQLDRPPSAMALDPKGIRLFLAYTGRIVSYTTKPLARSWHYRSPGANRGLYFRPQSAVLFSVRLKQVALFDPAVVASLKPEQRQKLEDEATSVVPLPFSVHSLLFSQDGLLAAAYGPGAGLAIIDAAAGRILTTAQEVVPLGARQEMRPLCFGTGPGDIVIGLFPDHRVETVHPPTISAAESPGAATPSTPAPTPTPTSTPASEPIPSPAPLSSPPPGPPEQPSEPSSVLAGRLTGQVEAVRAIVAYGPGSIVREQARATPGADGSWRTPPLPPGTYRVVPVGEGSRSLRSEPNFHTVEVKDRGRTDLDFKILGTD